jgi:cytidine deaminase
MRFDHISLDDLPAKEQELIQAAKKQLSKSYNLYSGYYVAAAVLSKNGKIYASANMENASYGLSICAEPGAIQQAHAMGDPEICCIAIVGGFKAGKEALIPTPCGRCRQIIYESAQISACDIEVICANIDLSAIIKAPISKWLPMPFGPMDLNKEEELKSIINRIKN